MPDIQQEKTPQDNLTGVISLVKIIQHFGIEINAEEFVRQNGSKEQELSWDELRRLAKKHRVNAHLIRPTGD